MEPDQLVGDNGHESALRLGAVVVLPAPKVPLTQMITVGRTHSAPAGH